MDRDPAFVEAVTGLDLEAQVAAEADGDVGAWAREESPLIAPRDARWEVAGVRTAWVDAIERAATCTQGSVGWQRTFVTLKDLLRSRRPEHRLVLVDRT